MNTILKNSYEKYQIMTSIFLYDVYSIIYIVSGENWHVINRPHFLSLKYRIYTINQGHMLSTHIIFNHILIYWTSNNDELHLNIILYIMQISSLIVKNVLYSIINWVLSIVISPSIQSVQYV